MNERTIREQGQFKNRRKSRSRRGNEAEVASRAKIRLLTSAATILELTLLRAELSPARGSRYPAC